MRILAGAVCRQHPDVLAAHLETMRWQRGDFEVTLAYVDDNEDVTSSELLAEGADIVLDAGERPEGADYGVNETTHAWAVPTFHHLAREKQRLLDLAVEGRYDAVFLVDTDLLLAPDTLASLVSCEKEVVSAVFWTKWSPDDPALPQVWQQHPYGFDAAGWTQSDFLRVLQRRELVRVRGLGACTLIGVDAIRRGAAAYWPLLGDLPEWGMWQGEDRHFCVRAERAHLDLWADAWPEVWHCYRPSDRDEIPDQLARLAAFRDGAPLPGDEVSFIVEPCEEPQLVTYKEHIRGRLGQLDVIDDVAATVASLAPGDAAFVDAAFPADWPLPEYRGRKRTLRVRLVAVR